MTDIDWVCHTPRLRMRRFNSGDHAKLLAMHREPRMRSLLVDDFDLDRPECGWRFLAGLAELQDRHPGLGIWHTERRLTPDPAALAEAQAAVDAGDIDASALHWLQRGQWEFCGWFNLMPMPEDPQRVEIGCRLLPSAWGTGLVLDGGEALLELAFCGLQLDTVSAACHPQHRSVHVVLSTLGFTPLGLGPYCGQTASLHRLDRNQWPAVQQRPRRQRQREAAQAQRDLEAAA